MAKRKVKDTEARTIQDVPAGEFLRIKRGDGFTEKVYKLEGYHSAPGHGEWWVDDMDDISLGRWLKKDAIVQVGFTY